MERINNMVAVYILLAILVLELLIFVHELGHFTVGKLLGFRILDFSLGFGPALIKFKKGETNYALRLIPFGGACQFDGEDDEEGKDPRRFNAQPVWKRFLVILAGPFMNVLMAFLIAFVALLFIAKPVYSVNPDNGEYLPQITAVEQSGPAYNAGLEEGDIIIAVNGIVPVSHENGTSLDGVVSLIQNAGEHVVLTIERDGVRSDVDVTCVYDETQDSYRVGISLAATVDKMVHRNVLEAAGDGAEYLVFVVRTTAQAIGNMFKNGINNGDVSGVVGTVAIMVDVASENITDMMYIAIILSLSLGLFNLIPFPALDGGRLLFLIIEAIIGRPLNRKVEGIVNAVGLCLLFGLMIAVTASDIIGLFSR